MQKLLLNDHLGYIRLDICTKQDWFIVNILGDIQSNKFVMTGQDGDADDSSPPTSYGSTNSN